MLEKSISFIISEYYYGLRYKMYDVYRRNLIENYNALKSFSAEEIRNAISIFEINRNNLRSYVERAASKGYCALFATDNLIKYEAYICILNDLLMVKEDPNKEKTMNNVYIPSFVITRK